MNTHSQALTTRTSRLGLFSLFGSTFFGLIGYFILSPLLLLRLKGSDVSTTTAGLFVATGWLGIFLMTPFASTLANRWGRRLSMQVAAAILSLCAVSFAVSSALWIWFGVNLLSGLVMALRWVLAEALIAEFCPPQQRGRYVGIFQTMVSATFIIGPAMLVLLGTGQHTTIWIAIAFSLTGFLWSLWIPKLPKAADASTADVGMQGLWLALEAHPIIMLAGFVGGFFETGVTSILPLYGLALGLGASASATMVSISGIGGVVIMMPAGMLADRFADQAHGRRTLMVWSAAAVLLATCLLPAVANAPWLAWPIVFVWGGAGGTVYTMAMTDIGSREKGITLVNSTAVLVLTYTLGGLVASGISGALIDWSAALAFPTVLIAVAAIGLLALVRSRRVQV